MPGQRKKPERVWRGGRGLGDLPEQMVLYSAQVHGVLPLTSACNVHCLFCSNRQNPPGVEVYNIPPRSLAEVAATLDFLNPGEKIVIGESATRINEGEPFTHPAVREILTLVRERFPQSALQITTNGSLLTAELAALLADLAPIELNISLNSASVTMREKLLQDRRATTSVQAPARAAEFGLPYHGSIVALPQITGWEDLEQTIAYLQEHKAQTVRVFLPGFTRLAPPEMQFPPSLHRELQDYLHGLRRRYRIPIILEPPLIEDLTARVEGIIQGLPAERAGLKVGDVITRVQGKGVRTRVEAFELSRKRANPELRVRRDGSEFTVTLTKPAGERTGLVMDYDMAPERMTAAARLVQKHQAERALVLTSPLAAPVVEPMLGAFMPAGCRAEVLVCRNRFFGGSIMAAGLLVVEDLNEALRERSGPPPDLILAPSTPFDFRGRDLTGRSWRGIGADSGVPVELV